MIDFILFLLAVICAVYFWLKSRNLRENLEIEKVRREWDLAWNYYDSHQKDFDALTKKIFLDDFPILKKVFERSTLEEIKNTLKNGSSENLPYFNNVDGFAEKFLYNGKASYFRKFWKNIK